TQTIFTANDDLGVMAASGRAWLDRVIARAKRDLLYLSLIVPAALFVLKLLSGGWIKRRARLILSAGAVALPLIIYALFRNNLAAQALITTAFIASLGLAL